jgi:hypothetical protein
VISAADAKDAENAVANAAAVNRDFNTASSLYFSS